MPILTTASSASSASVLTAGEFRFRLSTLAAQSRLDIESGYAVAIVEFERLRLVSSCLSHGVADRMVDAVLERLLKLLGNYGKPSSVWLMGLEGPFAVLIEDVTDPDIALTEFQTFLTALAEPIEVPWGEAEAPVGAAESASMASRRLGLNPFAGITFHSRLSQSAAAVIRNAEMALCAAAGSGANRCVAFHPEMRLLTRSRLDTEANLRLAVARGELVLYYQPIIDLEEGTISGLEALIRWNHPTRGIIPPGDFIPIAEETGLIEPIGQWVFNQACLQLAQWREQKNMPGASLPWISVNVSRKQLCQPDLVESFRKTLQEMRTDPALIHIEITESVIMESSDAPITLQKLRDLGLRLSMDDFGTGYSSLACLHQLPLDTIKIDRSFVSRIGISRDFAAAVHAIVSLARNLDMDVIAEGVEGPDQVIALQALDCRFAQGYHFGRPMPADQVAELVRQKRIVGRLGDDRDPAASA